MQRLANIAWAGGLREWLCRRRDDVLEGWQLSREVVLQLQGEPEEVIVDDLVHVRFARAVVDHEPRVATEAAHSGDEARQVEADDLPGRTHRFGNRHDGGVLPRSWCNWPAG